MEKKLLPFPPSFPFYVSLYLNDCFWNLIKLFKIKRCYSLLKPRLPLSFKRKLMWLWMYTHEEKRGESKSAMWSYTKIQLLSSFKRGACIHSHTLQSFTSTHMNLHSTVTEETRYFHRIYEVSSSSQWQVTKNANLHSCILITCMSTAQKLAGYYDVQQKRKRRKNLILWRL